MSTGIFNIYLIRKSSDQSLHLIYKVCAFCKSGHHQLEYYGRWKLGESFSRVFQFTPSFNGHFNGADLKVGLIVQPPHVFVIGISDDGFPIYGGQDYWYLEYLAKSIGFNIVIVEPTDGTSCSLVDNNGSHVLSRNRNLGVRFTGFCKLLMNEEVDIAGFPNRIDYLYDFVEITGVYHVVHTSFVSSQPKKRLKTTLKLKSSLLTAVVLLYASFICMSLFTEAMQGNRNLNNYLRIILRDFAVLCLEVVRFRNLRGVNQLLMGMWLLTAFFVISNVFGEITSTSVTEEPTEPHINTIEDLKERNISWFYYSPYNFHQFIEVQLPDQANYSKETLPQDGLRYILENPSKYVYLAPKVTVDWAIRAYFWSGKGENPFHFSPPIAGQIPVYVTNFLRKGSPYTETMTRKTLEMLAAGLLEGKFIPDTTDLLAQGSTANQTYEEANVEVLVTLESLYGYLWACMVLIVSSILVFIMELLAPVVTGLLHRFKKTIRSIFRRLRVAVRLNRARQAWR